MSIQVVIPQVGQSIAEATVVKWFKKPGDHVEKGEVLVEIGTDKINTELPAPETGVVESILVQEGETVPVETVIAVITPFVVTTSVVTPETTTKVVTTSPQETTRVVTTNIRTSPLVRKLAEEHNIDLSEIQGTGEGGRVTKEDILKVIEGRGSQRQERVPMSRMRKLIAEHMVLSRRTAADLTTFFEVDMSEVERRRQKAKPEYRQKHNLPLTYLPFVIVAVTKALQEFPVLNASIEGDDIIYKKDFNIGIATAIKDGLVVPVVKNVASKTILEITREAQDLAQRAQTNRLTANDLQEGTFTITNPGVFGAIMGTPIILQPQVAILGLGAVVKRPVVIQDEIVIRSMSFFSLTYDHRAMDGATADRFLAHVKNTLEHETPEP